MLHGEQVRAVLLDGEVVRRPVGLVPQAQLRPRVHHRGVVGLRIVDGDGAQHELIVPQPLEEDAVGIGQSHEAPRMPYS